MTAFGKKTVRTTANVAPAKIDNRTRRFKLSDSTVALDNHRLATSGWDLSRADQNMPVLWGHDAETPGSLLGQWTNIFIRGDDLVGDAQFMDGDVNPLAETALQMIDGGWLRAVSVGFVPLAGKPASGRGPGAYDFSEQMLLEASVCPVGSLGSALIAARSAGINLAPLAAWAERELDEGRSSMPAIELQALRRAAGGSTAKVYPAPVSRAAQFRSFGEQMQAIWQARASHVEDSRLIRAPLGGNENDPSSGGFLVQEVFTETLLESLYSEAVLAPLVDRRETSRPLSRVKIPAVDETSRADGSRSGGALSYWAAEAASVTASFPRFRQLEFSAKKLISICYASDELYTDAAMLGAHLKSVFASEFAFKLDQAILAGTGAGQPLGIINAPALVTVAKANGQAAASIVQENIRKMWSNLPAPCRRRATWIVSEDVMAQIDDGLSFSGIFQPAGSAGNTGPLLKGRPVVEVEQASALGTLGDIVLADLSQYIVVDSGMKTAVSADVQFLTDQIAFRFTLRIDGMPAWASSIAAYNGSGQRSPFVALAAR